MKQTQGLKDFCAELSSDSPSPGGGTASAAAGAGAASLLAMVCSITRHNKKYEERWAELDMLADSLLTLRDELVTLAEEDARAYDVLAEAFRRRRAEPTDEAESAVEAAIDGAIEVPLKTARACARILESASRVADIGTPKAHSDVAVAIFLAEAGVKGALMNVLINLEGYDDDEEAGRMRDDVRGQSERATRAAREALSRISIAEPIQKP